MSTRAERQAAAAAQPDEPATKPADTEVTEVPSIDVTSLGLTAEKLRAGVHLTWASPVTAATELGVDIAEFGEGDDATRAFGAALSEAAFASVKADLTEADGGLYGEEYTSPEDGLWHLVWHLPARTPEPAPGPEAAEAEAVAEPGKPIGPTPSNAYGELERHALEGQAQAVAAREAAQAKAAEAEAAPPAAANPA